MLGRFSESTKMDQRIELTESRQRHQLTLLQDFPPADRQQTTGRPGLQRPNEIHREKMNLLQTRDVKDSTELETRKPHEIVDVVMSGALSFIKNSPIAHKRLAYVDAELDAEEFQMDVQNIRGGACKDCREVPDKHGVCLSGYLGKGEKCKYN